jgi:hypothetical protein
MELRRRTFLKAAGGLGLLALMPRDRVLELLASPPPPGQAGHFLDAQQLQTLRALTYRLIPGLNDDPGLLNVPPDPDAGAREARCAEAIDILLGAFTFDPPMIHAGGPFSNRAGATHDDFADFIRLDPHAELGWRIRIEGTKGMSSREFAGPVEGLQEIYVAGLQLLDSRTQSMYAVATFSSATAVQQDTILNNTADQSLQNFLVIAFANTLDAMYGPPEYGGNAGLAGWAYTNWDGDVQPRGYTDAQVSEPGPLTLPPLTAQQALRARDMLPHAGGRPASRDRPWLSRPGFTRG